MNTNPHDHPRDLTAFESASESALSPAEESLRLIASLPSPDGLEGRVNAALSVVQTAARRPGRVLGRSRVLAWPGAFNPESGWMRTAAAAAIVFVVAGGGWGIYSRVESSRAGYAHVAQSQPAKVIVMPPRMPVAGGFSGAGAIRTPVTLPGPAAPPPAKISPAKAKAAKKSAARLKSSSSTANPTRP